MSRMSSLLILIAMVVTAGSVATVLDMRFGLPLGQAMVLGLGLLLVLVLVQQFLERRRDRDWLEARIDEIAAVVGDGQSELSRLSNRLSRIEQSLPQRVREESEPLAAEVEVVGQLLKQVAETLAELESRVDRRFSDFDSRTVAMVSRATSALTGETGRSARPEPAAASEAADASALFVGEAPGRTALFGGLLVLVSVTLWCIWDARQKSKTPAMQRAQA